MGTKDCCLGLKTTFQTSSQSGKLFLNTLLIGLVACSTVPSEQAISSDRVGASPYRRLAWRSSNRDTIAQKPSSSERKCTLVKQGFGSGGKVNVRFEEVVTGLEVPWGIAFLPNGDLLVTERPGRVRLVRNNKLLPKPVATIDVRDLPTNNVPK